MKEQLKILLHNPNDKQETAIYLSSLVADMLIKQVNENPKQFFELVSSLIDGGESEGSSIL